MSRRTSDATDEEAGAVSTPPAANARAILRPDLAAAAFSLTRHTPAAALTPFVDYHWVLEWDLTGRPVVSHIQH